jgi:predicted DNA-binding transcriptional regulator AlpA
MAEKLIPQAEIKAETGISHGPAQIDRLVEQGRFPAPVRVGRRKYWLRSELDNYILSLACERDGLPIPTPPELVKVMARATSDEPVT